MTPEERAAYEQLDRLAREATEGAPDLMRALEEYDRTGDEVAARAILQGGKMNTEPDLPQEVIDILGEAVRTFPDDPTDRVRHSLDSLRQPDELDSDDDQH